jgi:hypothetical protein
MRGTIAAAYFFGLGWYVRASGLDEDLARLARDAYDLAVVHTAEVARRGAGAVPAAPDTQAVP